jgi:hypothetical protein
MLFNNDPEKVKDASSLIRFKPVFFLFKGPFYNRDII